MGRRLRPGPYGRSDAVGETADRIPDDLRLETAAKSLADLLARSVSVVGGLLTRGGDGEGMGLGGKLVKSNENLFSGKSTAFLIGVAYYSVR